MRKRKKQINTIYSSSGKNKTKNYSNIKNTNRVIENNNNINLLEDLENNYKNFYSIGEPIYIHNHVRNFLVAGRKVQSDLSMLFEDVVKK